MASSATAEPFDYMAYAPAWVRPFQPDYVVPAALAVYLIPVGLAWTMPQLFPKRSAPKWFVQTHNAILVAWSVYMSFGILFECIPKGYKLWGNPFNPAHVGVAHYFYHFYISKFYEFMDTYIMLYRGKLDQVSFLHVFHHVGVFWTCFLIARHGPGGDPWLPTAYNAGVHILMYSYYFLCTVFGDNQKLRQKYLWWAKYLTQIQIFQFVVYVVVGVGGMFDDAYPTWITQVCTAYAVGLLILFSHFYMKRWTKGDKSKASATATVTLKTGAKKLA